MNRLKKVKILDELITAKKEQLERLKILSVSVSSPVESEKVQTSKTADQIPNVIAKIVDLENEINQDIADYIDLKKECMHLIDQLDDPYLIGIAYKRYFEYKTFDTISEEMHLSLRWVMKLNKKLLDKCS